MTGRATVNGVRERGQGLAEFALVIPIFLLLLIAAFDLGRAVFAYNSVTNAAREGARLAIVNQSVALVQQRSIAQSAMTDSAVVSVDYYRTTPNADYRTNRRCGPVPSATVDRLSLDCVAVVTFRSTYRPITPLISNIVFGGGVTLQAQSIQQVEYVCPNATVPLAANCPKQP